MEKRYENLEEALMKELDKVNKKMGSESAEMSVQDLDKIDKIYHALKSAETYYAMKEHGEAGGQSYNSYGYHGSYDAPPVSYARGRDSMGRYTSRDDGFSGRYPMYPMSFDMRY